MVIETGQLRELALASGAAGFGVTSSNPFAEARETLDAHKASGLSGPLRFTYGEPETATDVTLSYPWARSLVVFTHNYLTEESEPAATGAVVGRFAINDGYERGRAIGGRLSTALADAGYRADRDE